jgi:hypothetical protein
VSDRLPGFVGLVDAQVGEGAQELAGAELQHGFGKMIHLQEHRNSLPININRLSETPICLSRGIAYPGGST